MNIVVPVKKSDSMQPLINSGADEFYCGVLYDAWIKKYGNSIEFNRRGNYGKKANFQTLEDLCKAVTIAKKNHKNISLTANALRINTAQSDLLEPLFLEFKQAGGSSVIISDINLIKPVKRTGLNVTLSSCATVNNIYTARFYQNLGVNRIILPRNITLADMKEIIYGCPNMEFEAFLMNDPCRNVDGNCLGIHHTCYGSFCSFMDDLQKRYVYFFKGNKFSEKELQQNEKDYQHLFKKACGLCALYDLMNCQVSALKLAGRISSPDLISSQIIQIKKYMKIAEQCTSRKQFINIIQEMSGLCDNKSNCYYKI